MTRTDTELAVIAAVASTSACHSVLFGQRLTVTIKSTRGGQSAAGTRTITVRVRTAVRMTLFADILASTGLAVAGFAASAAGWVRKLTTKLTTGLERALRVRLGAPPVFASALVTERGAAGATLGCFSRPTAGVSTGWTGRLPETSGPPLMVTSADSDRRLP